MKVQHFTAVQAADAGSGSVNTSIRWLIAEKDGAPNFYMRYFEVAPGGMTPHHSHAWEHEIFIIGGKGKLAGADESYDLAPGMFAFVPGGEMHHLESAGGEALQFICLVPKT